MKDARWFVAREWVERVLELEWENLSYQQHTILLNAAQTMLDAMTEGDVQHFANEWNNRE